MKLSINNLTIQIPSLNYNNTYTKDSKYWNILLLPFSLFKQNQSSKDNSNPIKPNTYIHMNVKNSNSKNNNLQKPLPNTITIYFILFFSDCVFFSPFSFYVSSFFFLMDQNISIYVNIKPDKKTLHTFLF